MVKKCEHKKRIEELGQKYMKHILELDNEIKNLRGQVKGGGFFKNFSKGMRHAIHAISKPVEVASTVAGEPEVALAMEALDGAVGKGKATEKKLDVTGGGVKRRGRKKKLVAPKEVNGRQAVVNVPNNVLDLSKKVPKANKADIVSRILGGAKKSKRPSRSTGKRARRGALMKKIMKEQGLSFIEASKYIKGHGLKY